MHDNVFECLHGIKNQGINTDSWDAILMNILTKKLDRETHRLYESSLKNPKEIQTVKDFLAFLQVRFQSLGVLSRDKTYKKKEAHQQTTSTSKATNLAVTQKANKCSFCFGEHNLPECKKFQNLSQIERSKAVYYKPLCRRCLLPEHKLPCNKTCELCKGSHHSLLHSDNSTRTKVPESIKSANTNVQAAQSWNRKCILLGTALVKASSGSHNELIRVLIDPGSQATFITEEACQRLNLTKSAAYAEITGMGKVDAGVANSIVEFNMKPRFPSNFNLTIKALVFKNLTRDMPEQPLDPWKWKHAKNLLWADSSFYTPGPIDLLLGADYYGEILMNNIVKASSDEPVAQETKLGWIFLGRASVDCHNLTVIQSMTTRTLDLDTQLRSFWEIEEVPHKRTFTKEELECEKMFTTSHRRLKNGRYVVKIPFNIELYAAKPLGCSKKIAMARLLQVEKRLAKNPNLYIQYKKFMDEYIALGHMKIADETNESGYYYLPHHAVLKESSTTTKLRVVFDGSAKTSTGISLNDVMLTGPTLQQDLLSILLRWRKHKYVHTADIEKMFRQIIVDKDDQNYQRILWRRSPEESIMEYKLTTVTYGTAAATYLAVKSLQQLAIDEQKNYPMASNLVLNDFYVDDLISGQNTLEEALFIQKQVIILLKSGGFTLRKWATNNAVLLEAIPEHLRNQNRLEFKLDDTIKTLGLHWNPATDTFGFNVIQSRSDIGKTTKRSLLSDSAKLFDPLGWLAPITIVAKLMMQELWLTGLSWDEELPSHILSKWQKFKNTLPILEEISIPRWIQFEKNNKTELHGFCDASEKAYAATIYFKSTNAEGITNVRLLTSKTKVAPIKNLLSLPRLELCGALLLTKLMHQVIEAMQISELTSFFWTDSMITLCWIRGHPHKYKTFVANRISEIQSYSNPAQWRHVGSTDNPADCASRGTGPNELKNNHLWWTGPSWLQLSSEHWPQQTTAPSEINLEAKQIMTLATSTIVNPFVQLIDRFSNVNKIIRVVGYCRRFINKCFKKLDTGSSILLSAKELNESCNELIRTIQHAEFQNEIMQINKNNSVSTKSNLFSLNPFIDEHKMLRVGGRLTNCNLKYDTRHPKILPQKHRFTKLLIKDAHIKTLHGGIQLTLSHLRNQYWITNGRNNIRSEIAKCITCHRFNASSKQQLMASLPKERVTPSRPFTNTGVDYAGPISVRVSKGRGNKSYKGYIALFVCFATKAVHIEIVSDLTTAAFIAAFKRFISRRGLCQRIYSDNGTNFVGAKTQLTKEKHEALQQATPELQRILSDIGVEWHFIPPSSPHFGGLWEAAVKSLKYHLKRVIGNTTLTYEELTTVATQIEACLNSRPLTTISSDPNALILTPGHFLIGDSLITTPESNLVDENISTNHRWRLLQKMVQDFWKHWSNDYITGLQQRNKWSCKQPELMIDDIVLIKDNNLPPTNWPLGRIIELHPGKDNLTRVVTVKGSNGAIFKRPITKLSALPLEPNNSEQKEPGIEFSKNRTCAITKFKVLPIFLLSLVTMATVINPVSSTNPTLFNITKFIHQPGLYLENTGSLRFTNQQWKIVVYFNLTTYYTDLSQYKTLVKNIDQLCMGTSVEKHEMCSVISSQLAHLLTDIEEKNEILHYKTNRRKRGVVNIVGNLASDLFGVLDDRDAKHYEEEISRIKLNQAHLLTLIKNQTSIADSTLNILKRTEAANRLHWQALKQQINSQVEDINNNQKLTSLSFHALLLLLDFKDTQQKLIDAFLNSQNKAISTSILPPHQLKKALQDIKTHMPPDTFLPGQNEDHELLSLYHIISCSGRLSGQYLIFELKLPIINNARYLIYKPIPLPTTERLIIQPSMDYLVTSIHRDEYYMMSKDEFNHCKHSNNEYICMLLHPIHSAYNNHSICELNLLTLQQPFNCHIVKEVSENSLETWIKLKNNKWIFSIGQERRASIVCDGDFEAVQLPRNGIISLRNGCTLKEGSILLKTHKIFKQTVIDSSYLPTVNLSLFWMKTTTNNSTNFENTSLENDINHLHKQIIHQLQEEEQPMLTSTISHHDIHQYTLAYGMLVVIIIGCLIYKFKIQRRTPPKDDYRLETMARENVDTQQI